jgi:hypothetical protein
MATGILPAPQKMQDGGKAVEQAGKGVENILKLPGQIVAPKK